MDDLNKLNDCEVKKIETKYAKQLNKMLDLHARGIPLADISKVVDAPVSTVHSRIQRFRNAFPELEEIHDYMTAKSQLFKAVELRLLKSLMDKTDDPKATINGLAYAFKQVFDAGRLESGQSTANVSKQITTKRFTGISVNEYSCDEVQPTRSTVKTC